MAKLFTLHGIPMFQDQDHVEFNFVDMRFGLDVHFPNLHTEAGNVFTLAADVDIYGALTLRLDEAAFDMHWISNQRGWTYQRFLEQIRSWFPKTVEEMIERVRKEADDWIQEVRLATA